MRTIARILGLSGLGLLLFTTTTAWAAPRPALGYGEHLLVGFNGMPVGNTTASICTGLETNTSFHAILQADLDRIALQHPRVEEIALTAQWCAINGGVVSWTARVGLGKPTDRLRAELLSALAQLPYMTFVENDGAGEPDVAPGPKPPGGNLSAAVPTARSGPRRRSWGAIKLIYR